MVFAPMKHFSPFAKAVLVWMCSTPGLYYEFRSNFLWYSCDLLLGERNVHDRKVTADLFSTLTVHQCVMCCKRSYSVKDTEFSNTYANAIALENKKLISWLRLISSLLWTYNSIHHWNVNELLIINKYYHYHLYRRRRSDCDGRLRPRRRSSASSGRSRVGRDH